MSEHALHQQPLPPQQGADPNDANAPLEPQFAENGAIPIGAQPIPQAAITIPQAAPQPIDPSVGAPPIYQDPALAAHGQVPLQDPNHGHVQDYAQAQPPVQGYAAAPPSMGVPIYDDPTAQPIHQEMVGHPQTAAPMEATHETFEAAPGNYATEPEFAEDMSQVRPVPRVSIQAFCETERVASTLSRAEEDRRMSKAHMQVQNGGIHAAIDYYQTATTPNLIVIETKQTGMDLIGQLQGLADVCDEGTNVLVIGHHNDVQLYRELMSRGVSEYLVAPVSMAQFMGVVNDLFVNPDAEPMGKSLTFVGSKGGVGSSTIAHNVAFTISSNFMSDVILADFDLPFGTADMDFDQSPTQGVAEAVFSSDRVDDTFLDRLLAKCSEHLSLLAAPVTLDRDYDFKEDDFRQLLEVAQRGTPNVVVDLPHLWTGWARSVLSASDQVVITATPDLASLRNTKNLLDTLADLRPNDVKPLLVLNQCNVPKRPEISASEFCEPLNIEPTVVIPFEPALFGTASNNGQMIAEADPKSEVAASIELLSQVITGRRELQTNTKKGGSFLSKLGIGRG